MLFQIADVGLAAQKPEQFVDDRLEVQLLGGEERKAFAEIETHLMAEHRQRAGAGAVALLHPVAEDVVHQIEILAHFKSRGIVSRKGYPVTSALPKARQGTLDIGAIHTYPITPIAAATAKTHSGLILVK